MTTYTAVNTRDDSLDFMLRYGFEPGEHYTEFYPTHALAYGALQLKIARGGYGQVYLAMGCEERASY